MSVSPRLLRSLAALSLVACHLWFFAPLLRGQVLFERDIALFWQAQTEALVRAVGEGSLPWWDPHLSFGEPLMEFAAQVFYPPTWLSVLLPAGVFYSLSVAAHHLFGGAGLYLFLRARSLSRVSCVCGAALWMSSGPWLSVVNMLTLFSGASWMPWALLAADATRRTQRAAAAVLWGASIAACLVAGSETVLMAGLASGACFLTARQPRPDWRRLALLAALAVATALILSAAQWIPLLGLLSQTSRADLPYRVRSYWSLHPLALLQLGLPVFLRGLPASPAPALDDFAAPLFYSVFLGTPALALAASGAVARWRQGGACFAAVAVLALGVALGRHAPIYDLVAGLAALLRSIRYPVKLTLLLALAVAVLAAFGLEALAARERRARRSFAVTLVVLATLGILGAPRLLERLGSQAASVRETLVRSFVVESGLALGVSLAVLAAASTRASGRAGAVARGVAALLAAAPPAVAHLSLNAVAPAALLRYRPPLVQAIRDDGGTRIFTRTRPAEGRPYQPGSVPTEMDPAVALAVNYRQMLLTQVARLYALSSSYELDIQGTQNPFVARLSALAFGSQDGPELLRLLQLGAVTHVVTLDSRVPAGLQLVRVERTLLGEDVHLFRVPAPLPHCYVVDGVRSEDGEAATRTLVSPGFDPRREVILPDVGARAAAAPSAGSCRVARFGTARVETEVTASREAFLVMSDAYWPGWRASVDGVAQPLHRANVAFRAVAVPAGRHSVVFTYAASSVWLGVGVSLIGVVLGVAILGSAARRE